MICFSPTAQRLVGKTVDCMMRTVRRDEDFPPDIAGLVSQKFTFAITMTSQSLYTRTKKYAVNSIVTSYGRQRNIPHIPPTGPAEQPRNYPTDTVSGTTETLDQRPLTITSELSSHHQVFSPAANKCWHLRNLKMLLLLCLQPLRASPPAVGTPVEKASLL